MSGLVERLRAYRPTNEWGDPEHHMIVDEAASRIEALEGEVERLKAQQSRVRYARTSGSTLQEMRAFIRDHPLYQHGDAVLCWVNEGDLYMGAAAEIGLGSSSHTAGRGEALEAARTWIALVESGACVDPWEGLSLLQAALEEVAP